jgi:hypothetical protein
MAIELSSQELAGALRRYAGTPPPMWLLGAGASVTSGVPAARDLIHELLKEAYPRSKRAGLKGTKAEIDLRLRKWAQKNLPWFKPNHPRLSEYAQVMANVEKVTTARNAFLKSKLKTAQLSPGYRSLGKLIRKGVVRTLWTTNFDSLIERCAVGLAEPLELINSRDQFQLLDPSATVRRLIRLHGDFWHGDLVNTPEEFRTMSEVRYEALLRLLISNSLVVVGYGGQDRELMTALTRAACENSLGRDLFWCVRKFDVPVPPVKRLLKAYGRRGYLVRIEGFDQLMAQIEQSFSLPSSTGVNSTIDDPQVAWDSLALLAKLADELTVLRPPDEARDRRRDSLFLLCKLVGTARAAVVVKTPRGNVYQVDIAVDASAGESLHMAGNMLSPGVLLARVMASRAGMLRFSPKTARKETFFEEVSEGHPLYVIPVQKDKTAGFMAFTFEGDFEEMKVLRAATKLLVTLACQP